jgi:hypothetical protein
MFMRKRADLPTDATCAISALTTYRNFIRWSVT